MTVNMDGVDHEIEVGMGSDSEVNKASFEKCNSLGKIERYEQCIGPLSRHIHQQFKVFKLFYLFLKCDID